MADISVNQWRAFANEPMAPANPCNLMDVGNVKIPAKTGFLFKMGGGGHYGIYFPNGAEIAHNSALVTASAQQPIEVWDDTAGKNKQQLTEPIMAMLICDNSAKGLTFQASGSSTPGVDVTPWLTSSVTPAAHPAQAPQASQQQPMKGVAAPRKGRNTAASKIIGIGNWDVIPDLFAN